MEEKGRLTVLAGVTGQRMFSVGNMDVRVKNVGPGNIEVNFAGNFRLLKPGDCYDYDAGSTGEVRIAANDPHDVSVVEWFYLK